MDTHPSDDHDLNPEPAPATPPASRPAQGAREATGLPNQAAWQSSVDATDFLGLEPEVGKPVAPIRPEGTSEVPGLDTWLFRIESGDERGPKAVPGAKQPAQATATETLAPMPEHFGEKRHKLARRLAAVVLLGLVGYAGWTQREKLEFLNIFENEPAIDVATGPNGGPKPGPSAGTPAHPGTPTTADPVHAAAEPAGPTTEPAPEGLFPVEPAPGEPELVAIEPDAVEPEPVPATGPVQIDPPRIEVSATRPSPPDEELGPGGGRRASPADVADLWYEETIPLHALGASTRLRTLNVGVVRALLLSGEHIEGQLYAVGQQRIWLDVPLGRVSFEATDVKDLTRITTPQGGTTLKTQNLADLPRVEVLLPGGALMGRVLERNGSQVTLVTDEGMRLRVDALDVRAAPSGRSRLVGAIGQLGS